MAYSKSELINLLRQYAQKYGIDEDIAIRQIDQESRFNPRASSGKANGIAQFTPATAQRFGVNVWDVNSSFDGWGRYMRWLLDRFNGNYSFALAGYNAGEGRVDQYGGVPPFAETKNYVKQILGGTQPVISSPIDVYENTAPAVYEEIVLGDWPIEDLTALGESGVGTGTVVLIAVGVLVLVWVVS